jgi:hypothetical protein
VVRASPWKPPIVASVDFEMLICLLRHASQRRSARPYQTKRLCLKSFLSDWLYCSTVAETTATEAPCRHSAGTDTAWLGAACFLRPWNIQACSRSKYM